MLEVVQGGSIPYEAPVSVPPEGVLRVVGQGKTQDFEQSNGSATAVIANFPLGLFQCYWSWTADGVPHLLRTDGFEVKPLEGPDQDERILKAAKDALEAASGSDRVSLSVEGSSFSFMDRNELLAFVNRMERKVRNSRRRAELGVSKRGKVYIRRGRLQTGVW